MTLKHINEKRDLLSLLIATVAVLLSQFPPVYTWFYAPNLDIRTEESFAIRADAYVGLSIAKYYSVTNIGKESGRVQDLRLFIADQNGNLVQQIRAQNFRLPSASLIGQPQLEKFSEISLKPGDNWAHFISFGRKLNTLELEGIRYFRDEIKSERDEWEDDLQEQGYDFEKFDEDMPLFQISEKLLSNLKNAIKKKIKWFSEGDYKLYEVTFTGDNPQIRQYSFVIKEHDLKIFADSLGEFSYGLMPSFMPNVIFEITRSDDVIPNSVMDKINKYNK